MFIFYDDNNYTTGTSCVHSYKRTMSCLSTFLAYVRSKREVMLCLLPFLLYVRCNMSVISCFLFPEHVCTAKGTLYIARLLSNHVRTLKRGGCFTGSLFKLMCSAKEGRMFYLLTFLTCVYRKSERCLACSFS